MFSKSNKKMARRIQHETGAKYTAALAWMQRSGSGLLGDMLLSAVNKGEVGREEFEKLEDALVEMSKEYFTEDRRQRNEG